MTWHFRFRRSIPIIPGFLYWNINARSMSLTGRAGPVSRTWSSTGRRTTNVNLPGRGGSMRSVSTPASRRRRREDEAEGRHRGPADYRTDEERATDAEREELRRRIAARRENIRRMRRRGE